MGTHTKSTAGRDQRGRDGHRLRRMREHGLKPPIPPDPKEGGGKPDFALDCGWGQLVFAQTFSGMDGVADALREERADRRDIAFYVRDPHVVLANAPAEVFLDPSHTYRLALTAYRAPKKQPKGFFIRRLTSLEDAFAINRIYAARGMVAIPPDFFWSRRDARSIIYFVAEDEATGEVVGTVTGVDHQRAFDDPERGASLWCLAVDPQARHPGIGEALVRRLTEYFSARQASFLDLSVMHDNVEAIALYEKLGFKRIPYFTVKRKNSINEMLFTTPESDEGYNPYALIIIREARRRGIQVEPIDPAGGFFRLSHGSVSLRCRESLSELTSAVAMSICDDKAVTHRIVTQAGVRVPAQISAASDSEAIARFLDEYGRVVVKPVRGEQGRGVSVGLTTREQVDKSVGLAREISNDVLIEACIDGEDLRLIVINFQVVAAAVRRPPAVVGDGKRTVRELIEAQSRRRAAATGGESTIPVDDETELTLKRAGHTLDSVLEADRELAVRRTANLHTGGTIHDVTDELHPALGEAAVTAARAIDIPVTGIDLMVKSHTGPEYAFIEANERPGLANHEPQPTAERFIDLLFPLSLPAASREARRRQVAADCAP